MVEVIHQSEGLFTVGQDQPSSAVLPLQASPSDPTLPTLATATGLLSPDQATVTRLAHFPENLYDLREDSHLVRFIKALLGDAGAGQLRKRYTLARLQTILSGSHFYDLDGFYGAIFGAGRRVEEQLPINPMTSTAEPDEWDDISARDAKYRERIQALAKAIPMGATVPGLQQAAEALTGVECEVYETWRMLEAGGQAVTGRTFDQVEADFANWDAFPAAQQTWDSVTGKVQLGRAGIDNRDEVYIRPKADYTPASSDEADVREAARRRAEDEMSLQRVLSVLKPAGVLLTVDNQGLVVHTQAPIARLEADSEYWEVVTKVRPRPGLNTDPAKPVYPVSPVKASTGVVENGVLAPLPKPPFANAQGHSWSYNTAITSVNGYAVKESGDAVSGSGTIVDRRNWEHQVFSNPRHEAIEYRPGLGITDQRSLLAAQAAADSVLMAHPYSGPRVAVETHG